MIRYCACTCGHPNGKACFYCANVHNFREETMTEKIELPKSSQPWQCVTCGSGFAEYINGCPHCWEAGILSSVHHVQESEI